MKIKVAVCNKKTDKKYKNQEQEWEYLKSRNSSPVRTTETAGEYPKLTKQQRDALKDVGGYLGGWLKGGIRKTAALRSAPSGRLTQTISMTTMSLCTVLRWHLMG